MKNLIFLLFLTCTVLNGQTDSYKNWTLEQRLPIWSIKAMRNLNINGNYRISDHINPFYLEADFNYDNRLDVAIAVIEKSTNKKGIVIIHQDMDKYIILGAGETIGNGGDDFKWMDIWRVDRKNDKIGLHVEKGESASALISWDGSQYTWTQRGD